MAGRKEWELLSGDQGIVYRRWRQRKQGVITCTDKTPKVFGGVSVRTTDIHCIVLIPHVEYATLDSQGQGHLFPICPLGDL